MLTITKNQHLSRILRLAMCAAVSIPSFWYPFYIACKFAEYDHRMGFMVYIFGFPFLILATYFSISTLNKLVHGLKSVPVHWRYVICVTGVILAAPSVLGVLTAIINMAVMFLYLLIYCCRELLFWHIAGGIKAVRYLSLIVSRYSMPSFDGVYPERSRTDSGQAGRVCAWNPNVIVVLYESLH